MDYTNVSKKELILSCVGKFDYKSISKIFDVSIPYIYQLKNYVEIPNKKFIAKDRLDRSKYVLNVLIKSIILYYFKINNDDLMSDSRRREFVNARMFYTHYLIQFTPLNWRELGLEVNRDHASAMYYPKRLKRELIYENIIKMKKELDLLMGNIK